MTVIHNELWNNKAVGFVTRARQELWGKHNAEVMAWLFERGLSNKFIGKILLGWNRRKKLRDAAGWGIDSKILAETGGKIVFPEGIVLPYVVAEQLRKVVIITAGPDEVDDRQMIVEGSQPESIIFGRSDTGLNTVVADNFIDGLYYYQESGENEKVCVILPHDLADRPDGAAEEKLNNSDRITFLTRKDTTVFETWAEKYSHAVLITYSDLSRLNALITL